MYRCLTDSILDEYQTLTLLVEKPLRKHIHIFLEHDKYFCCYLYHYQS
jgi:hypothetical protein